MVCYPSGGNIIFSLKNLKFYEDWGQVAGGRGPDMRARGREPYNPNTLSKQLKVTNTIKFPLHKAEFINVNNITRIFIKQNRAKTFQTVA